jgi:hypothetical protein
MDNEIIKIVIERIPSWFLMTGVSLILINRICGNNINVMVKLMAKHNARKDKLDKRQNERIETILNKLEHVENRLEGLENTERKLEELGNTKRKLEELEIEEK